MSKDFITVNEAARILDKTTASVYLYVKQGRLKNTSKVIGEVRLDRSEVLNFVAPRQGRPHGYRKPSAKHPRLQRYYNSKRGIRA